MNDVLQTISHIEARIAVGERPFNEIHGLLRIGLGLINSDKEHANLAIV